MYLGQEQISIANRGDLAAIETLLNRAYRGTESKQGWTTEADLIAGEVRTNLADLENVYSKPGSVFLKYAEDDELFGCVNLQKTDNKIYLGMFAVAPRMQGAGIGKKMLRAAELYAKAMHAEAIFMSVISVRKELIDWYCRHGYKDTGKLTAFREDGVSGKHLQPLAFTELEKQLT